MRFFHFIDFSHFISLDEDGLCVKLNEINYIGLYSGTVVESGPFCRLLW